MTKMTSNVFEVLEPGHKYKLPHLESGGFEILTFIKRSSDAVDYGTDEHPGTNTQSVLRALIERTLFLNDVIPCAETQDAVYFLRQALYMYEVRAYRRKQAKLNKRAGHHESLEPGIYRDEFDDVPFSWYEIEKLPVGSDGHILVEQIVTK